MDWKTMSVAVLATASLGSLPSAALEVLSLELLVEPFVQPPLVLFQRRIVTFPIFSVRPDLASRPSGLRIIPVLSDVVWPLPTILGTMLRRLTAFFLEGIFAFRLGLRAFRRVDYEERRSSF